jgi:hypothetical protein
MFKISMSRRHKIALTLGSLIVLTACGGGGDSSDSSANTETDTPLAQETTAAWSQNQDLYSMQLGKTSLTVDADFGARITSFKWNNSDVLYTSGSLNGSTFWTSPQSDWNWPPLAAHDSAPYTANVDEDVLTLTSDSANGIRITKIISPTPKGAFHFEYVMTNTSGSSIDVAPWEVTRVSTAGVNLFPVGEAYSGNSNLPPTQEDSILWYDHSGENDKKLFRDGAEQWIAHASNGLVFIKHYSTDISIDEFASGEAEIEIYASNNYVELEQQGAIEALAPGESRSWHVVWQLHELTEEITVEVGSPSLVEFIRQRLCPCNFGL